MKKTNFFQMKITLIVICVLMSSIVMAQNAEVISPDGKLQLKVSIDNGNAIYNVTYNNQPILENSPLGLITNEGNFTKNLGFIASSKDTVEKNFEQEKIKQSSINLSSQHLKVYARKFR